MGNIGKRGNQRKKGELLKDMKNIFGMEESVDWERNP